MFAKKKIKLNVGKQKIKQAIFRIPYFIAKHDFLIFVLFSILLSTITLFYLWRYFVNQEQLRQAIPVPMVTINDKEYNKFLETSKQRQEKFWKAEEEEYKEVFAPLPKNLD